MKLKAIHGISGGSAGARTIATIATIATSNDFELSCYRAANLKSCQVSQHLYKRGGNEHLEIPNLLDRQFDVVEPDTVLCGDVRYIWTSKRWTYLAVIIDLFACKVFS